MIFIQLLFFVLRITSNSELSDSERTANFKSWLYLVGKRITSEWHMAVE